jgi:dTDP-glucose pyrophosphorylase
MNANMGTVLIPAAGFGKRVGSPPAKELLFHENEGAPMIQWGLDLVKKSQMKAVVITRSQKTTLLDYLEKARNAYPIDICLIDSSEEWPHTILQSQAYWGEKNFVLLPDTRFAPLNILTQMSEALDSADVCFATFHVEDKKTWGVIQPTKDGWSVAEKPGAWETNAQAWGLFSFRTFGKNLLEQMISSGRDHQFKPIYGKVQTLSLSHFVDVTR